MRTPLPSLQMCAELGAPVAVVLRAAAEQVVLPKISTYQLLCSQLISASAEREGE